MLRLEQIEKKISEYFQLPEGLIKKKTKKREIVEARQICHYFAVLLTKCNNTTIGNYFGGHDHSTVSHSKKTVENLCDTDAHYSAVVKEIKEILEDLIEINKRRQEREKEAEIKKRSMNDFIKYIEQETVENLIQLSVIISKQIEKKYLKK